MNTDLYRKVEVTDNHGNKRVEDQFDPSGVLMIAVVGLLAAVIFVIVTPFVALLWFYFSGYKKLAKFQNENIRIYKIISLISVSIYTVLLGLIFLAHELPNYKLSNTLPEAKIFVEDFLNIPADESGIVYVAISGVIFTLIFFLVYFIHNRVPKMVQKTIEATATLKQSVDKITKPVKEKTKSLKKKWISMLLLLITAPIAVIGLHRFYLKNYLTGTFLLLLSSSTYISFIFLKRHYIEIQQKGLETSAMLDILEKTMYFSLLIVILVFIFELLRLLLMSNEKFQIKYNPLKAAVTP